MVTIFPSSNFHAALVFILIIAIPFFIVLLIIHIQFGLVWPDSEPCSNFCRSQPTNRHYFIPVTESPTPTATTPEPAIAKEKEFFGNHAIGALLTNDLKLLCPIALISPHWSLTTSQCVPDNISVRQLKIRINSNYWSKGGTILSIDHVQRVQVKHTESNTPLFISLQFTNTHNHKVTKLKVKKLSEDAKMKNPHYYYYSKTSHKLELVKADVLPPNCCYEQQKHREIFACTIQTEVACNFETNAPFIAGKYLIGIHVNNSKCDQGISDVLKTEDVNWRNTHFNDELD